MKLIKILLGVFIIFHILPLTFSIVAGLEGKPILKEWLMGYVSTIILGLLFGLTTLAWWCFTSK